MVAAVADGVPRASSGDRATGLQADRRREPEVPLLVAVIAGAEQLIEAEVRLDRADAAAVAKEAWQF